MSGCARPPLPDHEARRGERAERQQPERRRRDRPRGRVLRREADDDRRERDAEQDCAGPVHRRRQRGEAPDGDQPPGGVVAPQLPDDERDRGAGGDERDRRQRHHATQRAIRHPERVAVADRTRRCDRQASGDQRDPSQHQRHSVEPRPRDRRARRSCAGPAGGDQPEREDACDRQVEPEDRLPGRDREDQPAVERAEDASELLDAADDPERQAAHVRRPEIRDQRERHRDETAAAEALERPARHDRTKVGRRSGHQ